MSQPLSLCDDCGTPVPNVPAHVAANAGLLLCSSCNGGTAVAGGGYLSYTGETWADPPEGEPTLQTLRRVSLADPVSMTTVEIVARLRGGEVNCPQGCGCRGTSRTPPLS